MRVNAWRVAVTMFMLSALASSALAQVVVTNVSMAVDPGYRKQQKCPVTVDFIGSISVNGPATVRYRVVRSDGAQSAPQTLAFPQGGTQTVRSTWTLGDVNSLPTYSGWAAIRILSPNVAESVHDTAAFTMVCGLEAPLPSPRQGRFRVVLTGFRAIRETRDHLLEADGPGDEIFQGAFAILANRDGSSRFVSRGSGPVFGRIRTGTDFPRFPFTSVAGAPIGGGIPGVPFEGVLVEGEQAVAIAPSLWEADGDGSTFVEWLGVTERAREAIGAEVTRVMAGPLVGRLGVLHTPLDRLVTLTLDREGDFDRPIGITLAGRGAAQYQPPFMLLTYEAAVDAVANAASGGDTFVFRFTDPPGHQGIYEVGLRIEALP